MRKQITRISPLQTAKVVAIIYFVISLPFLPFFMMPAFLAPGMRQGFPAGLLIFMPFLYAFFGFLFTLVGAWVYNLVARWVGGIEFTSTDMPSAPIGA